MNRIKQLYLRLLDVVLDWGTEIIALLLLMIGLIGYFRGANPYVPIFTEVIGIGLAVLLIDLSNKLFTTRNEKIRLILQMGSPDNGFAIEAVRQLRARGWLSDGSLRGANLYRTNLFGAQLSGARLQGANLVEANLEEAQLMGVNLAGATLSSSNLRGANLMGAYLPNAELSNADLTSAILQGAWLVEAKMVITNFEKAILYDANLEKADLQIANMAGAILKEANLIGANLRKANLLVVDLTGANLENANLEKAILKGAKVKSEQLAKVKSLEGAIMPDGTVYNPENTEGKQEEQEPPE